MNTEFRISAGPPVPNSHRRACQVCVVAKAKCSPVEGRTVCQRCLRLRKDCYFEESRPQGRKRKATSKVEQLEQKVDGLVALLSKQKQNSTPAASTTTEEHLPTPPSTIESPEQEISSSSPKHHAAPVKAARDVIDEGLISFQRADAILQRYKDFRLQNFPFVAIPPHLDLETLRSKAPMVLLAMLTACSEDDHPLQTLLTKRFKEILCNRLVLEDEKSLELLQALLIFLAFNHHQCQPRQQVYIFRHMAIALCGDLGLDRRPGPDPYMGLKGFEIPRDSGIAIHDNKPGSWAVARNRAFLGTYYCSNVSILFRRHATVMPISKWLDDCSIEVSQGKECPTDIWIRPFIQTSVLANRVMRFTDSFNGSDSDVIYEISSKSFQKELRELEDSLLKNRQRLPDWHMSVPTTLAQELKTIPVLIYEPFMFRNPATTKNHAANIVRLVQACRAACDFFVDTPITEIKNMCITSFGGAWFSLLMLPKLLLIASGDNWDISPILTSENTDELLERIKGVVRHMQPKRDPRPGQVGPVKDVFWVWEQAINNLVVLYKRYMNQRDPLTVEGIRTFAEYRPSEQDPGGLWHDRLEAEGSGENVAPASEQQSAPTLVDNVEFAAWSEMDWQAVLSDYTSFDTIGTGWWQGQAAP